MQDCVGVGGLLVEPVHDDVVLIYFQLSVQGGQPVVLEVLLCLHCEGQVLLQASHCPFQYPLCDLQARQVSILLFPSLAVLDASQAPSPSMLESVQGSASIIHVSHGLFYLDLKLRQSGQPFVVPDLHDQPCNCTG